MSIHICEACGKPIPDDAAFCPHCGAEQREDIRLTKIPETIEELRAFCAAHHMPLDAMRFFIGEDFRGPKAFGIYKDETGRCVVYKNKADGSRAVRYEGPDEKHAVRELYEKLKSETDLRRGGSRSADARADGSRASDAESDGAEEPSGPLKPWEIVMGGLLYFWKPIVIVLAAVLIFRWLGSTPDKGYYRYQDNTYYYQDHGWYLYNIVSNDWEETYDVPEDLAKNSDEYFESETYDAGSGATDFSSSGYYENDFDSDADYDDYDWDSGSSSFWNSWDSSDTDWDSDW